VKKRVKKDKRRTEEISQLKRDLKV